MQEKKVRKVKTWNAEYHVLGYEVVYKKVIEKDGKLYIELPKYVVEELDLKEGDYILALLGKVVDVKFRGVEL